ncbi:MAG TPA: glycerol-3-phosphate dehydrogenase/oxidase [Nevskiaceae bacterium]|nr:glycerol-3-phosphate dehydrogenase/oxidase [Nevskiaceae bacterium]
MNRDVAGLKGQTFDLLVIGGGIYGAWTACDAAQRGLKVALIEREDWASATSSSSSKLIHGGLRYLENYEFKLVRHALGERRVLSQIAPHLVRPLNFLVPVWKGARVGRLQLLAGLTLYDFLATGKQPVPRYKSFSRRRLSELHPYLKLDGLRGGLRYGDCQEDDARMTLTVVDAAQNAGAICANRVRAVSLVEADGAVTGANVRDEESGESFAIAARCVVNAAGPWARDLLGASAPAVKLVKGIHLIFPAIPGCVDAFLLGASLDERVFFVIPWYGRTLVGTTEMQIADPSQCIVTEEETRYLVDAVNYRLPGLKWTEADILGSYAGVRSLQPEDTGDLSSVTREFVILEPKPNLIMPLGGKFTTGRCDSVDIVDRVFAALKKEPVASRTHQLPLPGAPVNEFEGWHAEAVSALVDRGIDPESAQWLALRHGTKLPRLFELFGENRGWRERIHPDAPFLKAEAIHAVREEMARSLVDVVRRRMPLALLVRKKKDWLEAVARLIAPELGWDATEAAKQVLLALR